MSDDEYAALAAKLGAVDRSPEAREARRREVSNFYGISRQRRASDT